MAKAKKLVNKPAKITPKTKQNRPRRLKVPKYKSFRLHKPIKSAHPLVMGAPRLFIQSVKSLKPRYKVYIGIVAVYLVLSLVFVKGFSTTLNIGSVKEALDGIYTGAGGKATSTVALFGLLVGSSGVSKAAEGASVYQSVIILTFGLALLWTLRNSIKQKIRIRDGFYSGMYPVVQLVLVLTVLSLQLLPLGLGGWLYSVLIQGGVVVSAAEQLSSIVLISLLMLTSIYMLSSSLFALVIVTLPGVSPMQALRSARELVRHRRWMVIRKLLFLPFALVMISAVIMLPFLLWLPSFAEWVFFIVGGFGWLVGITYLYTLYKELLNE